MRHFNIIKVLSFSLMAVLLLGSCTVDPTIMQNREKGGDSSEPAKKECTKMDDVFKVSEDERIKIPLDPEPSNRGKCDVEGIGVSSWILCQVSLQMKKGTKAVYQALSGENQPDNPMAGLKQAAAASFGLVVVFYGIAVLMGVVQATPYSVVMTIVKITLVMGFAQNWENFDIWIRGFFEGTVDDSVAVVSYIFGGEDFSQGENMLGVKPGGDVKLAFSKVDETLSMFFSMEFIKLMIASMFSGPQGWGYTGLMMMIMYGYVSALISAMYTYLVAMVARHLLYAIAPLFFIFGLFRDTKSLFDGWVQQIISFTLQPIFLFTFLALFHNLITAFIALLLKDPDQVICYQEIWKAPGGEWTLYGYQFGDGSDEQFKTIQGAFTDLPVEFFGLIVLGILTFLMRQMMDWSIQVAVMMSSGFTSASNFPVYGWQKIQEGTGRAFSKGTQSVT